MPWLVLVIAGLFEISWAVGLKYSDGFTRLVPSVLTLIGLAGSMGLLAHATRDLPLGTAYAIWVGIGTVGAAILGVVLFREPMPPWRAVFLGMLVVSLIGLKLSTPATH